MSEVTDSSSSPLLEFFPMETIPSLILVCQQSLTCQPLHSPLLPAIVHINTVLLSHKLTPSPWCIHNIPPWALHVKRRKVMPHCWTFFPLLSCISLTLSKPAPCFLVLAIFTVLDFCPVLVFQQVSHTYMTAEMQSAFPQNRLCNSS